MFSKNINLLESVTDRKIVSSLADMACVFSKAKKELYLVGGCVRDLLLGKVPADYDLCTNLKPNEVKSLLDGVEFIRSLESEKTFKRYTFIDTGIKHGTITVHDRMYDEFFEITTYRVDGKYTDGRHPDEVTFVPSLEEDLSRRDFTVNSFAYDITNKEVLALEESFFNDLYCGIIRCVGDPTKRFKEDALRMLRAIRFMAKLGFSIDPQTYAAISKSPSLIKNVSKERIRDELTKILMSDRPDVLVYIVLTGLEKYLFNGMTPLGDMLNCQHENKWHYTDVFHHTIDVVRGVPKVFELKWAALLHDSGKPSVKAPKDDGSGEYRYHDHQYESEKIALDLMGILKFSNEQIAKISTYVRYHDIELAQCKMSKFKKALNEIGVDNFLEFMKLRCADSAAHNLLLDTKYAISNIDICYKRYNEVITTKQPLTLAGLAVDGYVMMDLGLKGKQVGDALQYLMEKVLDDPSLNEKEKLIDIIKVDILPKYVV